jgi:1,4-alpha-glucan branching enzyme
VDAVASILYLDYGRQDGQWVPNKYGGNKNLEAIEFFKHLNSVVRGKHPGIMMIAEESTAWPGVTRPVREGGLGFHLKWNMGWMNDTCHYMGLDPYFRQFHHRDLTFPLMYAFSERYILPISHDEVTHGKSSYLSKIPGDDETRFAGVRAFYAHMMTQPGKKLSFMGSEFGQWKQWDHQYSLDWHLLEYDRHRRMLEYFKSMNAYYLSHPALWEVEDSWKGFQWLSVDDKRANTIVYLRMDRAGKPLLVACNFSGEHRRDYRVGLPFGSTWSVDFNTDSWGFGGGGRGDSNPIKTEPTPALGQPHSLTLDLPPMSCVIYQRVPPVSDGMAKTKP